MRDLLGLRIDAAKFLPSDDSSHGFDNMAGTLTTSPALMEAYLSAAGNISRLAVGTETTPTLAVFDAPHDTSQNEYVEGLPFGTRGGMLIEHEFPADGDYTLTVKGMTGYFAAVLGNVKGEIRQITVTVRPPSGDDPKARIKQVLEKVDGVTRVEDPYEQGGGLLFALATQRDCRADVSRAVVDAKLDLLKLDYARSELENTFIRLVGGADASN